MRLRLWLLVSVFVCLFVVHASLDAQSGYPLNGILPGGHYSQSSIDSVDLDNGNLIVKIPIVSYKQKGSLPDLTLIARYNPVGWAVVDQMQNVYNPEWFIVEPSQDQQINIVNTPTWVSIGGGIQIVRGDTLVRGTVQMPITLYSGEPGTYTQTYVQEGIGTQHVLYQRADSPNAQTMDGSGIAAVGGDVRANLPILDSRGNSHTAVDDGFSDGYCDTITDPFGNKVTAFPCTAGGLTRTDYWIDSVGRQIPAPGAGYIPSYGTGVPSPTVCGQQQFPSSNNSPATFSFCYSKIIYSSSFGMANISDGGGACDCLTSIVLPNGTSYTFTYNTWGELSNIGLPTGGSVSYQWQTVGGGTQQVRRILSRTENANDGSPARTWTYSSGLSGGMVVTDPEGNDTWKCSTPGTSPCSQPTMIYYQGRVSAGVVLKSVMTTYCPVGSGYVFHKQAIPEPSLPCGTTTTFADGETFTQSTTMDPQVTVTDPISTSNYDSDGVPMSGTGTASLGFPVMQAVSSYGASAPGTTLKTTQTQYLWQANRSYLQANMLNPITSTTVFDANNHPVSKMTFGYDENNGSPQGIYGNETSITQSIDSSTSIKTTFVYNSSGMVTDTYDANINAGLVGNHIHTIYDSTGMYPATVTQSSTAGVQHVDYYSYDQNTSALNSDTDQNGTSAGDPNHTTTYSHDSFGRLTLTQYPDGGSVQVNYNGDPSPPKVTVTTAVGSGKSPMVLTQLYNGLGQPTQKQTDDSSGMLYQDTAYDGLGRVTSVSNPYRSTSDSTFGYTSYAYDALGRKTLQCQPDNGTGKNPCVAGGSYQQWTYNGSATTFSDENRNSWIDTSDVLGRLTQVAEPGNMTTTYVYDILNNLKTVTQAGTTGDNARTRSFSYDQLSRLITSQNPETGTICYGLWSGGSTGSGICQNGYDANGNLISKTDARGITTTYSYDALNRLISKTYSDGTVGAWYGYDGKSTNGGSLGQPSLNAVGRLSQQSNFVNIASTFSYDPMGRLSQVTQCIPTDCSYDISTSASYDLAGNIASMTYPDGRTVQNVWDSAGRLSNVNYLSWGTTNVNQPYFSESNGYDPAGHLIAGAFGNGVPMSAAYDNRERMINLVYGPTTGPLWSKQYAWTPNSNMQSATDLITGVQRQFAYDNLNRLTTAQDIYSSLAVPSLSNGNTVSTTTSGSAATETPGTSGASPQWTDTDDSNLLTDIGASDSTWLFANAVVAPNAAMAPDGSMTATTVTATGGSVDTYVSGPVSSPADYSLETVSGSVWLRSFSGTQIINIFITDDIPGTYQVPGMTQILLTTQWQQFKVTGSVLGNNLTGLALQIGGGGSVTDGGGFMMWNPMLEDEGHSGSSVTNFAPYSQLMTAATWASSQGTVSPDTVPAPDGTNTGATLTANTGSTDNWVVDTVANPAPLSGIPMTGSVWLRVPSGTQQINVNLDEIGSTGFNTIGNTTFTVTTDWQRFQVTGVTQSVLNQLQFQIGGGGSFTNGAVVYAWGAQLEMSSSAGPYVATASVPVTMGTSMTNLLTYSQDPTNWSSAAVTIAGNSVTAPDGSMTAARLTATGGDSYLSPLASNPALYDGETLTASVYLKSESGTPTINLYPYCFVPTGTQYFPPLSVTLSSVWQRFQTTGSLPSVCNGLAFQIGGANSFSSGQVIDVWGAQMEIAPQAGPYVATSALPIIAGRTLTNILPNSQAISGPDWTLNSGSVSANSSSAPDGTNTATTFSANAGSGDSYLAAFVPNPSLYDGQTVTSSVYLRAISGTQNVNLYLINAGNQGWAIASQSTLSLTTSWQRFTLTSTLQNGLQSLYLQIGGGGTVVGGQGYEIWGAQFNVGSDPTPYTSTPSTATVYATGASGTPVTNGLNQTYAYDSFGNILQNGSFNTTYTANNQMYAYPYDAAGNLLSDRVGNNMTWDADSRISTVGGAKYLYDGDGNRVEKQGSSVTDTIYFGGKPIARLSGGQWTDLIYGPNGLLAEVPGTQTASPMYRVTDNLGTDVGSLLADGSFVNPMDHAPFGQVISGSTNDPYFLTGKERDTESGLDYFGARYYGSSMGRFMSPDDGSDQNPFNPQSWNLYSYGRNNPLIGRDDDGHTYNVCPPGATSGSSQCTNIDDKTFEAEQKQDQANGVSYAHGTISDSSGVQGTYTHDPDIAGDPAANIAAMGNIGNQGMGAINWFAQQMVINAATDGLVGAAGAALEASPLATQIGRNALKGAAGEATAKAILRMRGYKIVGEQVSVMTSAGRRVVDFVVEKGGEMVAIEVKTGDAVRSTSQLAKDAAMASEGARVGASGGALAGQTLKLQTIEMRPF